jgi:hypothetical protein
MSHIQAIKGKNGEECLIPVEEGGYVILSRLKEYRPDARALYYEDFCIEINENVCVL